MSLTRAEVIAYLDRLSTTELAALIDELQQRLGLRPLAVAPQPVLVMGAPIYETEFKVVLLGPGPDKRAVIQAYRELVTIGVMEARDRIDRAPVTLREDLPRDEAEAFAERLRRAGAHVEIR